MPLDEAIFNKSIIYETLNIFTLVIAIILHPFVKDQYFIDFHKYLTRFKAILEKLLIKQITVLDLLDKGTITKRTILLIDKANDILSNNKYLYNFFVNYFKIKFNY